MVHIADDPHESKLQRFSRGRDDGWGLQSLRLRAVNRDSLRQADRVCRSLLQMHAFGVDFLPQ